MPVGFGKCVDCLMLVSENELTVTCWFQKPENTKNVKIGSLIALMVAEGEDWKAVDIPADAADRFMSSCLIVLLL